MARQGNAKSGAVRWALLGKNPFGVARSTLASRSLSSEPAQLCVKSRPLTSLQTATRRTDRCVTCTARTTATADTAREGRRFFSRYCYSLHVGSRVILCGVTMQQLVYCTRYAIKSVATAPQRTTSRVFGRTLCGARRAIYTSGGVCLGRNLLRTRCVCVR